MLGSVRAMFEKDSGKRAQVDLNGVIREVLTLLEGELRAHNVLVQTDFLDALPEVSGNRVQLQQVIVNLTINAIQAATQSTRTGRMIRVRTKLSPSENVCCTIEDSGPGVEPAHLSRLFDSFFTTKNAGMGLGLAISRHIIEAHDGRIQADNLSSLGGARFRFALPANAPHA